MNFWEKHRTQVLKISQRQMAARLGISNSAIGSWESDETVPQTTIGELAKGYEVSESVIERELIAQRRRVEAKREAVAK